MKMKRLAGLTALGCALTLGSVTIGSVANAAPAQAATTYVRYTTGCVGTSLVKFKVVSVDYDWLEEVFGGKHDYSYRTIVYNYGYYPACGTVRIIR
jgi:hypothetical protein